MTVTWVKAPGEDRCCMGSPLGEDYRCWAEALTSGLWCDACQRGIDLGYLTDCDCPGCSRDYMAEVAHIDGSDG